MDSAPLNLAHFHERRADKFLRKQNFDDALKAVEMSLLYLQDAYKSVRLSKSVEVLDTQKWDLERKLRQIQMRKQQHERAKLKEIVPTKKETASVLTLRPENSVTAQSVAKSIDKTIRDFDARIFTAQGPTNGKKQLQQTQLQQQQQQQPKENQDPKHIQSSEIMGNQYENRLKSGISKPNEQIKRRNSSTTTTTIRTINPTATTSQVLSTQNVNSVLNAVDMEDLPALAPLELPAFDFDVFPTSAPTIQSIAGLAESLQK